MFEVGDKVVYPHHGAGTVLAKEFHEIRGERREYLTIEILQPPMIVMVPCENAETAGLRPVINERAVSEVLSVLAAEGSEMPAQWNQRFKRNQEKLRSGDILELAEVVRNLERRQQDARLSPGEMQMLERARRVLVSELMYARHVDEEGASQLIDDALAGRLVIKHKPSSKRVAPKPPPKADPKAAAAARAAAAQQSRTGMRPAVRPPLSSTPPSAATMAKAALQKAAAKATEEKAAKAAAKPAAKAPAKAAAKPAAKPAAKKAAAKPAAKAPVKAPAKPAAKSAAKKAAAKPAAKAPVKAAAKPAAKPAAKAPVKAAAKTPAKAAAKPAAKKPAA
ncbi:MAG: CarD family transcriptional regulator, partial [Thermoleophilia bacterium]